MLVRLFSKMRFAKYSKKSLVLWHLGEGGGVGKV